MNNEIRYLQMEVVAGNPEKNREKVQRGWRSFHKVRSQIQIDSARIVDNSLYVGISFKILQNRL